MNKFVCALAVAPLALMTPTAASAAEQWGGQTLQTFRDCSAIPLANGCTPLPGRFAVTTGGAGQTVNTGPYTRGLLGTSSASASFAGPLLLPTVFANDVATVNGRNGVVSVAVQTYDWTGAAGTAFPLTAFLSYVVTAANNTGGNIDAVSNSATINGFSVLIFDPSIMTPASLLNGFFASSTYDCSTAGVIGNSAYFGDGLAGAGATRTVSLDVSTGCSGSPITLAAGQKIGVALTLGVLANREGALTDAVATMDIAGSNSLKAQLLAGLSAASGVPEPTSWAMMLFGFGFVGAALRRRVEKRRAMV